ncbi:MAG: DUF4142 domain-containing protein [Candidatus Cyclobacteriaceae bacterium M3_2C_046]
MDQEFLKLIYDDYAKSNRELAHISDTINRNQESAGKIHSQQKNPEMKEVEDDVNKLQEYSGNDFDKKLLTEIEDTQKEMIKEFEQAEKNMQNLDKSKWVSDQLVVMRNSLNKVQQLNKHIN